MVCIGQNLILCGPDYSTKIIVGRGQDMHSCRIGLPQPIRTCFLMCCNNPAHFFGAGHMHAFGAGSAPEDYRNIWLHQNYSNGSCLIANSGRESTQHQQIYKIPYIK